MARRTCDYLCPIRFDQGNGTVHRKPAYRRLLIAEPTLRRAVPTSSSHFHHHFCRRLRSGGPEPPEARRKARYFGAGHLMVEHDRIGSIRQDKSAAERLCGFFEHGLKMERASK